MEKYRGELWFSKLTIALIMSGPSILTCIMTVIFDWVVFLIVLMTFICYKFITTNPSLSSLLKFPLLFRCNSHFLLTRIPANPGDVFHKLIEKYLCNIIIFRLLCVDYRFLLVNRIVEAFDVITEPTRSVLLILLSVALFRVRLRSI